MSVTPPFRPLRGLWGRKLRRRAAPLTLTCAAGILALLGGLVWRARGEPLGWDAPLRAALMEILGASPLLGAASALGDARVLALACAVFTLTSLGAGRLRDGLLPWCAALAASSSSIFLKAMFDRPRPPAAYETGASFPSTHATMATAVWLMLALLATRRSTRLRGAAVAGAFCAGVLSSVAGVADGRHWPSDVVGGFILGLAVASLGQMALQHWRPGPEAAGRTWGRRKQA